jgi:hypothetical protein
MRQSTQSKCQVFLKDFLTTCNTGHFTDPTAAVVLAETTSYLCALLCTSFLPTSIVCHSDVILLHK